MTAEDEISQAERRAVLRNERIRHQLSDSTLTGHFDGQILDPGSLNWLRIEAH
jgi:hypothetical protein